MTHSRSDSSATCRALEPLSNILIGTALDEHSDDVVRTGTALARIVGAKVHLVHAAEIQPVVTELQGNWFTPALQESVITERKSALQDQLRRLEIDAGQIESLRVRLTSPHRALLEAAKELPAHLLVIGATTHTGPLGRLFGSTADRVTRQVACPILIVRRELPLPPRKVLAPVDLSSLSADALHCGLDLLRRMSPPRPEGEPATDLEVLLALDLDPRQVPPPFTPAQLERFAADELAEFIGLHAGDTAARVRTRVVRGEARQRILERAAEETPDLVMLGTHGHGGAERLLLGSVASEVARAAPVNVLLIPPAASLGSALAEAVASQTAPVFHREVETGPAKR